MLDKLAEFAVKYDMFPPEGLILAAVSGGADSMCLLTALLELSQARHFKVAAVHFNHMLRDAESDRDARFVKDFCHSKNVTLYSGSGNVASLAKIEGLGIEEAARRMRYDFFYKTAKNINAQRIATAHTADDNAETILLNLTRGTGLKGLGGIPPKRGTVIRPMLTVTRDDVIQFLSARQIPFVEDSTNALDIYNRNVIRHRVIPVLRELNPCLTEHLASAAGLFRDDDAYLNSIAERYVQANCCGNSAHSLVWLDAHELGGLPRPISSRVIRLIFGNNLSSAHILAVLALCQSGSPSGEVALPDGRAYREYDRLVLTHGAASGYTFAPVMVSVGAHVKIPELRLTVKSRFVDGSEKINKSFTTFLFKYDNICGNIVIRPRETGDKIEITGRNGSKTLKKLFIERRIPRRSRSLVPIIADDKGVLAVYGIGIDSRAVCKTGDKTLEIIFEETAYEK